MKNKNPLYVVKGKDVEEASGLVDMLVKKLNIQPLIDLLKLVFQMILDQVDTYPKLKAAHDFINMVVARLSLFKNFSFA